MGGAPGDKKITNRFLRFVIKYIIAKYFLFVKFIFPVKEICLKIARIKRHALGAQKGQKMPFFYKFLPR